MNGSFIHSCYEHGSFMLKHIPVMRGFLNLVLLLNMSSVARVVFILIFQNASKRHQMY